MDQDPDAPAIREVLSGDPDAYGSIVERNQGALIRALVGVLGDPHQAEDVAQEVWLIAYRRLESFRFESRFRTWLIRIAIREALSARARVRRLFRQRRALVEPAAARVSDAGDKEEILLLLRRLPAAERAAFVMHVEGFRYEEIAEALSWPAGTVATRIHRARQRLARVMGAGGERAGEPVDVRSAEAES